MQEQKSEGRFSDWCMEENHMRKSLVEGSLKAYAYFFYPNKETLVMQAILAGL